jgi:hypothetical protein
VLGCKPSDISMKYNSRFLKKITSKRPSLKHHLKGAQLKNPSRFRCGAWQDHRPRLRGVDAMEAAVHAWSGGACNSQLASILLRSWSRATETFWFARSFGCRCFICSEDTKIGKKFLLNSQPGNFSKKESTTGSPNNSEYWTQSASRQET